MNVSSRWSSLKTMGFALTLMHLSNIALFLSGSFDKKNWVQFLMLTGIFVLITPSACKTARGSNAVTYLSTALGLIICGLGFYLNLN